MPRALRRIFFDTNARHPVAFYELFWYNECAMKNIKNSVCDRIRLLSDKVKYECENITLLLSSLQGDVFGQTELRERKAYALYLKARESVKLISDEAFYASEYFS